MTTIINAISPAIPCEQITEHLCRGERHTAHDQYAHQARKLAARVVRQGRSRVQAQTISAAMNGAVA